MDELIVFPDAVDATVEAVRTGLEPARPDVYVGAKVPSPRPPRFVTIERVGGIQNTIVTDQAMLSVQAWAQRADDAYSIAAMVRALIGRMAGHKWLDCLVYRVDEVGGVQHSPDPVSDQERYIFTVQLLVRGYAVEVLSASASIAGAGGTSGT